jgi:hypothetical protein
LRPHTLRHHTKIDYFVLSKAILHIPPILTGTLSPFHR